MACSNPLCEQQEIVDSGRCAECQALPAGALVRRRYRIEQMLGRGGFGTTYLISDQDCFNEVRVLKELRPFISNDEEESEGNKRTAERLFKREAEMLLRLKHPGIADLYAYFAEGGYSYLVQDFIPGRTLWEEVEERKQPFTEMEALAILADLADILEYLHTLTPPVIHRDIKPQNLMRHSSGQLLLIDFGAVCQAVSSTTTNRTLIGTPGFAPVEQIFGQPVPQSDLYASGVTILCLLSGLQPNQLFNSDTQRTGWESRIQISPKFGEIIKSLLAQDVNQRLSSANELKRKLEELTTESSSPALIQTETIPTLLYGETQPSKALELPKAPEPPQPERPSDEIGRMDQTPLIFLLGRFYQQRLTGLLTCSNRTSTKSVHFDEGTIVFASSTSGNERIGDMLMRSGRITISDFERASAIMKMRNVRVGSALIEMGKINPDELKSLLTIQASNIVYSLFNWLLGRYEVRCSFRSEEQIKISLPTAEIIFEGLKRMENIDLVKSWLGDFTRKVTTTTDPLLHYQTVNLNPKEAFIVSRIESVMSIEEILSLGVLPEAEILKLLCGLLSAGILVWAGGSAPATRNAGQQPMLSDFNIQMASAFCYEVEHTLRSIENANFYAVLGIERKASSRDIEEAYTRMARRFHPDMNSELARYNFSLRTELEQISSRISEAYRVLSDPAARDEYDSRFPSSKRLERPARPNKKVLRADN